MNPAINRRRFVITAASAAFAPSVFSGAVRADSPALPSVFLEDAQSVARVRARIKAGDKTLDAALADLKRNANAQMKIGPFSVTTKEAAPPSGDKHDYLSQGIYWWPDPTKPGGLPYINKDGQINPEARKITDEGNLVKLRRAIPALAQAFYFTGEEKYGERAALLLKTWFVDPQTRMNPHFKYAQFIPGVAPEGRSWGIVDGESFIPIMDAVGFLENCAAWTKADGEAMKAWAGDFCTWLTESKAGQEESRAPNNHGTVYDAILTVCALSGGKTALAKKTLEGVKQKRIAALIEAGGKMPSELKRTKAWTYSGKNLMNLFWLASMGDAAGVDLWNYRAPNGGSLQAALDYLLPFAGENAKPWPYKEISHKDGTPLRLQGAFLRHASRHFAHGETYEAELTKQFPDFDQSAANLLYPAPPTKAA